MFIKNSHVKMPCSALFSIFSTAQRNGIIQTSFGNAILTHTHTIRDGPCVARSQRRSKEPIRVLADVPSRLDATKTGQRDPVNRPDMIHLLHVSPFSIVLGRKGTTSCSFWKQLENRNDTTVGIYHRKFFLGPRKRV